MKVSMKDFALVQDRETGMVGVLGKEGQPDKDYWLIIYPALPILESIKTKTLPLATTLDPLNTKAIITRFIPLNNMAKKLIHGLLDVSWGKAPVEEGDAMEIEFPQQEGGSAVL